MPRPPRYYGHFILVRTKLGQLFSCVKTLTYTPYTIPILPTPDNTASFLWPFGARINGVQPYDYFGIHWWITTVHWVVSRMFLFCTSYSSHFMNEIFNISESFVPKYIQMRVGA